MTPLRMGIAWWLCENNRIFVFLVYFCVLLIGVPLHWLGSIWESEPKGENVIHQIWMAAQVMQNPK